MTRAPGGDEQQRERDARADWERRIYRRLTDTSCADESLALPAPTGVRADGAVRARAALLGAGATAQRAT